MRAAGVLANRANWVMLTLFGLLIAALLAAAVRLSAPPAMGALGFVNGSFGTSSRADFESNPSGRFAPQRVTVSTRNGHPAG
jgi:hypothetical protein